MPVTFTIDLEDPSEIYAPNGRYVTLTHHILELCDRLACKATFFTIGRVAEAAPKLITTISEKGHEIAYHSHNHVSLTKDLPETFRAQSAQDKDKFEQLTGKALIGFRAPRFSLTPKSIWALDALKDLGFLYSSSIMPTDISLFGFPSASAQPFKWPNGLLEFPLPVATVGKYKIPYLGGIYLYTMPLFIVRQILTRAASDEVLWTYTHPYDFDKDEEFRKLANTPLWVSLVLWRARRKAAAKVEAILRDGCSVPLGEHYARLKAAA
jgi:polysaccharide deacetylase family protein (PEP-CTERM system associated)